MRPSGIHISLTRRQLVRSRFTLRSILKSIELLCWYCPCPSGISSCYPGTLSCMQLSLKHDLIWCFFPSHLHLVIVTCVSISPLTLIAIGVSSHTAFLIINFDWPTHWPLLWLVVSYITSDVIGSLPASFRCSACLRLKLSCLLLPDWSTFSSSLIWLVLGA